MSDIANLIGNIEQFPVLAHWDFFQHAGASPLPKVVADAVRKYADDSEAASYLNDHRYSDLGQIRAAAAGMINAHADEIALLKNTAEGISIVARGIDFQPGDRIVTAAGEYPANVYPWMDAAQRHKLQLIFVPETVSPTGERSVRLDAILAEAAKPRTKVVALSHVEYATGQRHDLAAIGKFCRERNIFFCVDAIQALGALPVDVQSMSIDYLAAGGQKWMLAPEGSAIFYCRRELIEQTPPLVIGAVNVINNLAYGDYDFTLQKTAGRFESGTYAMPSLFGFRAAIELLHNLGSAAISQRIKTITDRLISGLKNKGYTIASPRTGEAWSGIVSFTSPMHDHATIAKMLKKEHHTEIAIRESRLRASPHFYNSDEQIDRLIEHLPGH